MCTQLGEDASALGRLRALLFGAVPEPLRWTPRTVRPGRAEGPLRGGNLAVLASLCGTPLQPSFRGAIVLLEDLNEPAYRLDRLCTQLLLAGAFAGAAGFVVGDLAVEGEDNDGRDEAVGERLATLGVPVVLGAPFGHAGRNQPVALGVPHAVDAGEGVLVQSEPMLEKRGGV
jgi:muramoyltetrapeptide carboxypeptidase